MSATNETPYYGLPQFIGSDKPTWQGDINGAFETIDGAIHHLAENGGGEGGGNTEIVQTIGNSKTAVMSQNAVSRALATKLSATGIKTVNGESLIGEGNIETGSLNPENIATINGQSITQGGNIEIGGTSVGPSIIPFNFEDTSTVTFNMQNNMVLDFPTCQIVYLNITMYLDMTTTHILNLPSFILSPHNLPSYLPSYTNTSYESTINAELNKNGSNQLILTLTFNNPLNITGIIEQIYTATFIINKN